MIVNVIWMETVMIEEQKTNERLRERIAEQQEREQMTAEATREAQREMIAREAALHERIAAVVAAAELQRNIVAKQSEVAHARSEVERVKQLVELRVANARAVQRIAELTAERDSLQRQQQQQQQRQPLTPNRICASRVISSSSSHKGSRGSTVQALSEEALACHAQQQQVPQVDKENAVL
jgi:hypothetical protein